MIQPRNYCTQAMEQLAKYHFAIDHDMLRRDGVKNMRFGRDIEVGIEMLADMCAHLLLRAQKFLMPDWGRIFDERELEIFKGVEVPNRLPYPVIASEFHCDYQRHMNLGPHEMPSSKRIALAVEFEVLREYQFAQLLMPEGVKEGFVVMPLCYFDYRQLWTPPPSMAWMKREEHPQDMAATPIVTPLGLSSYSIYPDHEKQERCVKDFSDEVIATSHLLLALSMERTHTETLPAPAALNKKRAKKKKPPLFEYKVLDIVADIMEAPREIGVSRPQGKHASPRMHKRRGHVRRLTSDRVTWVRNTIVGKPSRGEIRKDYNVHHEELP